MKVFCSCLLAAACFSLNFFFFAVPFCAGEDILPSPKIQENESMSRADRLLLLGNAASLWNLHVSIGEGQPKKAALAETFGLVENGRLSASFAAWAALQIRLKDENAFYSDSFEPEASPGPDDIPAQYDMRISYKQLEITALEWLGWPFDRSALPRLDSILQKEDSLYIETQALLNFWPSPKLDSRDHDFFACPHKIYREGDKWILQGEIWDIQEMQNGVLNFIVCDTFRMEVKKADSYWRILSLDFNV